MISKVADNIWKINANSNIYVLTDKKLVIDAGDRQYRDEFIRGFKEIIDPAEIKTVLLTHLHYDHTGNVDLFPNATFYAHREEIKLYEHDPFQAIFSKDLIKAYDIELRPLGDEIQGLKVIHTPGHTKGSASFLFGKILFSGDTLFFRGITGRTDLPTSAPEKIESSVSILEETGFEILCPGHDY
jgi:glyoxylase-like metal-dependent hydrolase (beta-lactamase superfamily II)